MQLEYLHGVPKQRNEIEGFRRIWHWNEMKDDQKICFDLLYNTLHIFPFYLYNATNRSMVMNWTFSSWREGYWVDYFRPLIGNLPIFIQLLSLSKLQPYLEAKTQEHMEHLDWIKKFIILFELKKFFKLCHWKSDRYNKKFPTWTWRFSKESTHSNPQVSFLF